MNRLKLTATALAAGMTLLAGGAIAHDGGAAGAPVCLEANFMLADAMFKPAATAGGAGRVLEMNIFTGERGITVPTPFIPANNVSGNPICPPGVSCKLGPGEPTDPSGGPFGDGSAPFKPTGVLSGGLNGHAFITSAGQHALTEFHRDGTPIRTLSYNEIIGTTQGPPFGTVPRPLGSQFMPNGNIIQAICDANFNQVPPAGGGAPNSDPNPGYWPPVWTSAERAQNSRLLVIDQETLEVIDEYSAPDDPRWGCMAGIQFSDEGMFVSMFHGAAVFVIDWMAGMTEGRSTGVGSNSACHTSKKGKENCFEIGDDENKAEVIRVIDMLGPDAAMDDGHRRDSMRAISFDESGNLYGTNRRRSEPCLVGDVPGAVSPATNCNPGVWRQRVDIVFDGEDYPEATLALDPGVNVIAGIRVNRMSGVGCDAINPINPDTGLRPDPDTCDVETLYVAASAMNPGCTDMSGPDANPCFVWGGSVAEYLIDPDHLDGGSEAGDGSGMCDGNPLGNNGGCAQPIATFFGSGNGEDNLDPRMLMHIHEAFVQ
jgi:hypothetical protein